MSVSFYHGVVAIACVFPVAFFVFRTEMRVDYVPTSSFWGSLILSVIGPITWVFIQLSGSWHAGISTALWVSVATTLSLFAMLAWSMKSAWRLTPLLAPYMILMGILAILAQLITVTHASDAVKVGADAWLIFHIVVSVATYALVTIAAVSSLAAFIQDRALKSKRPTTLTHKLPSVSDCESLTVHLLGWGEAILGLGVLSGMAAEYEKVGTLLALDHKSVFSILAFVVIGSLLFAHHKTGMRGRRAARVVLLGYLLLTLGYLGVKVVTDLILA